MQKRRSTNCLSNIQSIKWALTCDCAKNEFGERKKAMFLLASLDNFN